MKKLNIYADRGEAQRAQREAVVPKAAKKASTISRDIEAKLAALHQHRVKLVEALKYTWLNRDVTELDALIEETNDFLDDSSAGADFGRVEVKADDFLPTGKEVEDEKKFDDIIGRH